MVDLKSRVGLYRTKIAEFEERAQLAEDPQARASFLEAAAFWRSVSEQAERMDVAATRWPHWFRRKNSN